MSEQEASAKVRAALDESEKALLDEDELPSDVEAKVKGKAKIQAKLGDLTEEWQQSAVPFDLAIPRGEEITIMRFKSEHCQGPAKDKGDRTCVLWPLSVRDERVARQRMFGDSTRGLEEMSKAMIRSIDGRLIDPNDPQQIERFWDEIGPRHRSMLVGWYQKTHNLSDDERLHFLVDCVAMRTAH